MSRLAPDQIMRTFFLGGLVLLTLAASQLSAQSLFTTTRGPAAIGSDVDQQFNSQEVLVFDPGSSPVLRHFRNQATLTAFLGDVDGNGIYDDFDVSIDALCPAPVGIDAGFVGFLFSIDQSLNVLGTTIEDGDIVVIQANGQVTEYFDEAQFAIMTSTSTIDVDAFHWADDGSYYFSFAQDEVTTSAALIAANNGDAILDESSVFVVAPGAQEASLLFDRTQILGFVNQAMGTSLSTIVDVTGFSPDLENPGAWLFTTGSSNSVIEGRVFSTFAGGTLASLNGIPLDSTSFGCVDEEILESLVMAASPDPVLNLYGPDVVQAPPGIHAYEISGASPFQLIHMAVSFSLFPAPPGEPFPLVTGFPWLLVNSSDPFLYASLESLAFSAWVDPLGRARLQFDLSQVGPGLRMTMQAVDLATFRLSPPITAWN